MPETLSPKMQRQLLMLAKYMQALSQDDLKTTQEILALSERDEVLARMILEVNSLYQEDLPMEIHPAEQAVIDRLLSDRLSSALPEVSNPAWSSQKKPRSGRTFQGAGHNRAKRMRVMLASWAAVLLVAMLVGSFALIFSRHRQPSTGSSTSSTPLSASWHTMPFPMPNDGSKLTALKARSQNDAWAVGDGFLLHWNGKKWKLVVTDFVNHNFTLYDVAVVAENDVWVAGYYKASNVPGKGIKPLLAHWNGRQWSLSTSPSFPALGVIYTIAAISPNDIWATGNSQDGQDDNPAPLILHWDGQQWSSVSYQKRTDTSGAAFYAMAALSENDVWLVGSNAYKRQNQNQPNGLETLIEHWDGTSWKIVPSPNPDSISYLTSITASSQNDIWAVGAIGPSQDDEGISVPTEALLIHWDGKSWKVVPQSLPPGPTRIVVASAGNADNVWLISSMATGGGATSSSTLARWDGHQWNSVSYPDLSDSGLAVVASIPGTDHVWVAWGSADKILLGPA